MNNGADIVVESIDAELDFGFRIVKKNGVRLKEWRLFVVERGFEFGEFVNVLVIDGFGILER